MWCVREMADTRCQRLTQRLLKLTIVVDVECDCRKMPALCCNSVDVEWRGVWRL